MHDCILSTDAAIVDERNGNVQGPFSSFSDAIALASELNKLLASNEGFGFFLDRGAKVKGPFYAREIAQLSPLQLNTLERLFNS